jgi:hypothetical protein
LGGREGALGRAMFEVSTIYDQSISWHTGDVHSYYCAHSPAWGSMNDFRLTSETRFCGHLIFAVQIHATYAQRMVPPSSVSVV